METYLQCSSEISFVLRGFLLVLKFSTAHVPAPRLVCKAMPGHDSPPKCNFISHAANAFFVVEKLDNYFAFVSKVGFAFILYFFVFPDGSPDPP